ncbi:MAG: hypothetical protein ABGX22_14205, partial [Pirellulaceae bacterium]
MNRARYALSLLFATITGSLLAVGTSHGQCWMDGRIGPPNLGLCPIAIDLDQSRSCYVVGPPLRPEHFLSEYDEVHDHAVYHGEPAVALPALADPVTIDVTIDEVDDGFNAENAVEKESRPDDESGSSDDGDEYYDAYHDDDDNGAGDEQVTETESAVNESDSEAVDERVADD